MKKPAPVKLVALKGEMPLWTERLQAGLSASVQASRENLGHLEEVLMAKTRELSRLAREEASQATDLRRSAVRSNEATPR